MDPDLGSRVLGEVELAEKAILDATINLPELQQLNPLVVANAFCLAAMKIASTQGHDAARAMFREFIKIVDGYERDSRAN
jgi:hypothetical protein